MAKYDLKKAKDGQFMFNLKAGNGEVILTSELYTTKAAAENGIESVKTNAPDDARYERRESKANQPYFVLKAANGQEIGRSEMYASKSACENGIESVKKNGPIGEINDMTD
ncbi:MAG: YegP family protein [Phycisphaerales bacterium]